MCVLHILVLPSLVVGGTWSRVVARSDGGLDKPEGFSRWEAPGHCVPTRYDVCNAPFGTAAVGHPNVPGDPAETWVGPGLTIDHALTDADGHPLTWGRVVQAHNYLVRHATCADVSNIDTTDATGYDSDGDRCPCTYHPVAIEERGSHLSACRAWPGPICGTCWAASCECGFVFDALDDAHSRWPSGRLRCYFAPRELPSC